MNKKTLYGLTMLSMALFFLLLLGIIFGCAGTWGYLLGWLYWGTFSLSTLAITLFFLKEDPALIERRIRPVETRPQQIAGQSVAALLFFGGIVAFPALDHRFAWTAVPLWLSMAADAAMAAGFYLVFQVFRVNTFTSRAVEVMAGQRVIQTGPYAWVRHPMYAGAAAVILASPLALGSFAGLGFSLLLIGIIVLRLRDEEALLLEELEGYRDYCARVPYRLVPFLW